MVDNRLLQREDIQEFIQEKKEEAELYNMVSLWVEGDSDYHRSDPGQTAEEAIAYIACEPYDSMEPYEAFHLDEAYGGDASFTPEWAVKDSEGNKYYADRSVRFSDFWGGEEGFAELLRYDYDITDLDDATELAEAIANELREHCDMLGLL